jgi:hypothetical protein
MDFMATHRAKAAAAQKAAMAKREEEAFAEKAREASYTPVNLDIVPDGRVQIDLHDSLKDYFGKAIELEAKARDCMRRARELDEALTTLRRD